MITYRCFKIVLSHIVLTLVLFSGADKVFAFMSDSVPGLPGRPDEVTVFKTHYLETSMERPEFKSKTRARLYSVAFTAVPLAFARLNARGYKVSDQTGTSILLILPGILAGPSAGSIYSDDWTLAKRSILIRSASSSLMISGHFIRKDENFEELGLSLFIAGGLLLVSHALYDILILSAHSVDFYNATIQMETGFSLYNALPNEWNEMRIHSNHNSISLTPGLNFRLFF